MSAVRGPKVEAQGGVAADVVLFHHRGHLFATIVAKAAFRLVAESLMTLLPPEPIHRVDLHHGGEPHRSARVASDLAPRKLRADVVLFGSVELGEDASAGVRLAVLRDDAVLLDKRLHVVVDWAHDSAASAARAKVPLLYERTYGGLDFADNPAGTGRAAGSSPPSILDPSDPHEAVGFGPIAAAWPARARLVADALREDIQRKLAIPRREGNDLPVLELPADFDWSYFQSAPQDQRIDYLRGDEWVLIDGVVPKHPKFRSRLPGVRGVAKLDGPGGAASFDLSADALTLDAERRIATVVFRGVVPIEDARVLASTVVRVSVEGTAPQPMIPRSGGELTGTIALDGPLPAAQLPFGRSEASAMPSEPATPVQAVARPKPSLEATMPLHGEAPSTPLPFLSPVAEVRHVVTPHEAGPQAATPSAPQAFEPSASAPVSEAAALPESQQPVSASRFFHRIAPPSSGREAEPEAPRVAVDEPPPRTGEVVPFIVEGHRGRGPLTVATVPWELVSSGEQRRTSLTVIVKATCDLVAGAAARPRPMASLPTGDLHLDGVSSKSLAHASDFAPFKPRADVTLTGHAYSEKPDSGRGGVRFAFGHPAANARASRPDAASEQGFDRVFAVFGRRRWERALGGMRATDPEPFERLRISYENAFGGPGFDANPLGMGLSASSGDALATLPHFESSAHAIGSPSDAPPPASFAPIAPTWRERWSRMGTFDDAWLRTRWPYLPADADLGCFQSAPKEQQLDYLMGDEPYSIAGMHPVLPVLAGTLPKIRVRVFARKTEAAGGALEELVMRLDTAAFDVDAMSVHVVFRGVIEVSRDDAPEIGLFFVTQEPLGETPASIESVRARLARAIAEGKPEPSTAPTEVAAAFAVAKMKREAAHGKADEQRAKLVAAAEARLEQTRSRAANDVQPRSPQPASPKVDVGKIATRLRRAGLPEIEIEAITKQLERGPKPPSKPAATSVGRDGDRRERVLRRLAAKEPLDGEDLSGLDLSGVDFSNASLGRTNLKEAVLRGAIFRGARLSHTSLGRADLTDAIFDGAVLEQADLCGATLELASFKGARLEFVDLSEVKGARASFAGATGRASRFSRGSFVSAVFEGMQMEAADFGSARLDDAVFDRAELPNIRLHQAQGARASFFEARLPGARADGTKFQRGNFKSLEAPASIWNRALLDEASFAGARLGRASFYGASCRRTHFGGADLLEVRFDRAELVAANFTKSNLMNASMQQAAAADADFRGANLYGVNAWRAHVAGALLDGAIVDRSGFGAPR